MIVVKTNIFARFGNGSGSEQQQQQHFQRGQVVVLRSARDPHALLIKRVVGVEGDWVLAKRSGDREDASASHLLARHFSSSHDEWVRVPKGRVWVEGDNEATSTDDSRQHGPLPVALVIGRASYIVWPPARAGPIPVSLEPAGGSERIHHSSDAYN